MRYFQHDTDSRTNRKLRKVIRTHGPTGFAIWWAVLEELYSADNEGFQLYADELWLEGLAESLCISDYRTLIRVLDTFSEIGLIEPQLWEEHHIYVQAIKERGDRYIEKKLLNAKRQARFREKRKQEKDEQKHVSNALRNGKSNDVTLSEAEAYAYTDPNTDPYSELDILSNPTEPELVQSELAVSESPESLFDEFWSGYPKKQGKKKCRDKYLKLLRDGHTHKDILGRLEYDLTGEWEARDRKYIPMPYTWLNREDWTDLEWKEEVEQESDLLSGVSPKMRALWDLMPPPAEWVEAMGQCGIEMEYEEPGQDEHYALGFMIDHSDGGKPFIYWQAFHSIYPPEALLASLANKGLDRPDWLFKAFDALTVGVS